MPEDEPANASKKKPATPESVARVAIGVISLLVIMKVVASIFTGSIGIRADAVHSAIDLAGAVVGYIGIKVSRKPPDGRHAFGHGKAENIAGVAIAVLIFLAAGTITYEAVLRLITGTTLELVTVGIGVTATAIVINSIVSWYSLKVARAGDSVALEATARDLLADVLSSVAVLVGLILVGTTGIKILDPIAALLVAVLIIRTAYLTLKRSFGGIMDSRLPQAEEEIVESCIMAYRSRVAGFHKLRTRKAGSQRYLDLHLVISRNASVDEAHALCDQLEQDIESRLGRADVTIHIEPCSGDCDQCPASCDSAEKQP